jgi:hypothetical protein
MEKKSLSTHENADLFLGMVKLQPEDISIVAKMGTFLMWYDTDTPGAVGSKLKCPVLIASEMSGLG